MKRFFWCYSTIGKIVSSKSGSRARLLEHYRGLEKEKTVKMASSEHRVGSEDRGKYADHAGTIIEYSEMETALKKEKARAKSNFTRARNKLLSLIEAQELPSHRGVQDASSSVDNWLGTATETMASLSDLYIKHKELENGNKVVIEMEKIEYDFSTASEAARDYLDSRRDDRSSVASDILSTDLVHRMNISDHSEKSSPYLTKTRIVFDAAATFEGVSLNDTSWTNATAGSI